MLITAEIRNHLSALPPAYNQRGDVYYPKNSHRICAEAKRNYDCTDDSIADKVAEAAAGDRAALEALARIMQHPELVPHTPQVIETLGAVMRILTQSLDKLEAMLGAEVRGMSDAHPTTRKSVDPRPITGAAMPLQRAYETVLPGMRAASNALGVYPRISADAVEPIKDMLAVHTLLTGGTEVHQRSAFINLLPLNEYCAKLGEVIDTLRAARVGCISDREHFETVAALERKLVSMWQPARVSNFIDAFENCACFPHVAATKDQYTDIQAEEFIKRLSEYYHLGSQSELAPFMTMMSDDMDPQRVRQFFHTEFTKPLKTISQTPITQNPLRARATLLPLLEHARQMLQEAIADYIGLNLAELPTGTIAAHTDETLQTAVAALVKISKAYGAPIASYTIPHEESVRRPALHTSTAPELVYDLATACDAPPEFNVVSSDDSDAVSFGSSSSSSGRSSSDFSDTECASSLRAYAKYHSEQLKSHRTIIAQKQSFQALVALRRQALADDLPDIDILTTLVGHLSGTDGNKARLRRRMPLDIFLPSYKDAIARIQDRSVDVKRRALLLEYLLRSASDVDADCLREPKPSKAYWPLANELGVPDFPSIARGYRMLRDDTSVANGLKRHITLVAAEHLVERNTIAFDQSASECLFHDVLHEAYRPRTDSDTFERSFEPGHQPLNTYTKHWFAHDAARIGEARELAHTKANAHGLFEAQRARLLELLLLTQ